MKILITDFHNSSNRGDAAIVEGMVNALNKSFSNPKIEFITEAPQTLYKINRGKGHKNKFLPYSWRRVERKIILNALIIICSFISIDKLLKIKFIDEILKKTNLYTYIESDLIISVGGSHLNDFYKTSTTGRLKVLYLAKKMGKPVYVYAQSIGPLSGHLSKLAKKVLNSLDLITLRDKISYDLLIKAGVKKELLEVTVDSAFSMDLEKNSPLIPNSVEELSNFLKPNNKLKISFSIREWKHAGNYNKFIKNISKITDKLIEKHDVDIYFASTCTGFGGYHSDDRIAAIDVVNNSKYKDKIRILAGEYTPQELLKFYKNIDLHVGTRMHSNILAMMSGTAIVPIQYEFKTKGLMEFFNITNIIDINNIDTEESFKIIEKALEDRTEISKNIVSKLNEMKEKSFKTAELIKNDFEKKYGST